LGKYTPQVFIHSGKQYWKFWSLGNKADDICNGRLKEWVCWTYPGHWGVSDGGRAQVLTQKQIVKETIKPMATQGSSLYDELRDNIARSLELLAIGKNLYIDLTEKITRKLNVSNYCICRGVLMSDKWPWKWSSLDAY
jgi:hypothetical protein